MAHGQDGLRPNGPSQNEPIVKYILDKDIFLRYMYILLMVRNMKDKSETRKTILMDNFFKLKILVQQPTT